MRWLSLGLTVALVSLVACRGRTEEQRAPGIGDTVRALAIPYTPTAIALSDFRPQIAPGVDTGGRCREDAYAVRRWGLRGVRWRLDGPDRRFWRVDVAIDSTGVVRRYYEDRYAYTAGRTIIRVDFDEGRGSVENSVPGEPEQTAVGDAGAVFRAPNLDDPSRQAARVLERCRAWLDPWGVLARFPDSLRPPPEPRRPPRMPTVDRSFRNPGLGVGYLKAGEGAVMISSSFEWLQQLILPLYEEAGRRPSAWLARGWLALPATPEWRWNELVVGGLIGTGYDAPVGFLVLDLRDNGWFRFRYAAPAGDDDGTAWAHEPHLTLGDVDLSLTRWEDHFLAQDVPTYFRTPGRHALRQAPTDSASVLEWLEGRVGDSPPYSIEPLEMNGDWMRVRAQWPGHWCGAVAQRTMEGWIRWRLPDQGPILAPYGLIC